MPESYPSSEAEFRELMERIDRDLQNENVPLRQRPTKAHTRLFDRFSMAGKIHRPGHDPEEGSYKGLDLIERAYRWYDQRYGDRI